MIFIQPSDEENASIVTLKQQLTAAACTHPFTDVTVLRFLRGRKHVMDKALNGLIKHVEWREEYHVDTIVTDTSSFNKEIAQRKCIVSGFDRHGRPILYIVARNHDKNQRNLEELRSFIIHTIENTMRRAKPDDEKIIIVFDLSKFTLGEHIYKNNPLNLTPHHPLIITLKPHLTYYYIFPSQYISMYGL